MAKNDLRATPEIREDTPFFGKGVKVELGVVVCGLAVVKTASAIQSKLLMHNLTERGYLYQYDSQYETILVRGLKENKFKIKPIEEKHLEDLLNLLRQEKESITSIRVPNRDFIKRLLDLSEIIYPDSATAAEDA